MEQIHCEFCGNDYDADLEPNCPTCEQARMAAIRLTLPAEFVKGHTSPHSWGTIFRNSVARGDDPGHAATLADEWEKRIKRERELDLVSVQAIAYKMGIEADVQETIPECASRILGQMSRTSSPA